MSEHPVITLLTQEELVRVDHLATVHRCTRDEMLARIIATGLLAQEQQARQTRRGSGGKGSVS